MLAGALLSDYSDPVDLSDLKTKVLERIQAGGIFESQMALALAKAHLQEPERSMSGTVSALSPLTGDAFYEGKD